MEQFNTDFVITVKPHGEITPMIRCGLNELDSEYIKLTKETLLHFNVDLNRGSQKFLIEFNNKTNNTPDMAVEIVSVTFEGMTFDRFKWASKYYPDYPEPWASEQRDPLALYHNSCTYLGWNGIWVLEFETPIFTWIHQLEHLGWIYD